MRTTIEITNGQRAELLKIAAGRGEKGFSAVVRDALDAYLEAHAAKDGATRAALGMRGALVGSEGDELSEHVRAAKARWR